MRITWTSAILVVVISLHLVAGARASGEFQNGEMLDRSNWQKAEGLLPPEILKHYREGEYANKFVDWPATAYNIPPDFKAGGEANAGKLTTGALGEILDKATNQQPPYLLGPPFPNIDAKDPAAGVKIVWNYFYAFWYFGNIHAESQVNWIGPTALERRSDQDVRFFYYDGVPEAERPPNPQNFLTQQLIVVKSPADLQGLAALTWRYRDADKRDSTWSFVPALRRVRAVSPANRSDGFLGSDMAQDDGQFFDGKPEDFEWHLQGQQDALRLSEETNLKGISKSDWISQGTGFWRAVWPNLPFLGYMDPKWTGVAWAPTAASAVSKRRFWVVEGVPRDKYYLFGKIELYIDTINYQGAWNRKFSWKGELLNTMQVMQWNPIAFTRPDGKIDYNQGSNQAFQCAENLKMNRATVAGIKSGVDANFDGRVTFDAALFDVDALSRYGK